jgi:glutathione synthase/RimK-type ligase-like ATP-grasp enzyme
MRATLGDSVVATLQRIERVLGLDYGGVDFGIDSAGNVVVFEANATMAVYPPAAQERWTYRQSAYQAIVAAVRAMIASRSTVGSATLPRARP